MPAHAPLLCLCSAKGDEAAGEAKAVDEMAAGEGEAAEAGDGEEKEFNEDEIDDGACFPVSCPYVPLCV